MMRQRIFGPPGTGKTTLLISEADAFLASGNPNRIGYVAFSKKAASEALDRIDYPENDLPYFRTLHSLCYRALGVTRRQVLTTKDLKAFGAWLGIDLVGFTDDQGMPVGDKLGDRCMRILHLSRNRLVSLSEQWKISGDDVEWHELDRFARALEAWKNNQRKIDFTDMLERFAACHAPELDLLIVDEAQDLTPLQWRVVETLAAKAERILIAGDDDQAVYHWAGADVGMLIDGPGEARILDRSYRLPRKIFDEAAKFTSKISNRVSKQWEPNSEGGTVQHVSDVSELKLEEGTWYLLARNRYLLKQFIESLRDRGLLYTTQSGPSVDQKTLDAIRCWEGLRAGHKLPATLAAVVYDNMLAGAGYKRGSKAGLDRLGGTLVDINDLEAQHGLLTRAPWFEAMNHLGGEDVRYLRACLRHGEQLSKPRIHVSTIHGVKGGEADHVAILPDMSWQTWDGFQKEPDHELRVFYVAVTRARQSLTWLHPQTNRALTV